MHCPFCNAPDTKVTDSRLVSEGEQVRRRRECLTCNERFTTFEAPEVALPRIIKRDSRRNPFDEEKLRTGISRALEKRPVSTEQVEACISHILRRLRACGEREISSQLLGEWVMDELRSLDEVAYIRFASVYLDFPDVKAFDEAIKRLKKRSAQPKKKTNDTAN